MTVKTRPDVPVSVHTGGTQTVASYSKKIYTFEDAKHIFLSSLGGKTPTVAAKQANGGAISYGTCGSMNQCIHEQNVLTVCGNTLRWAYNARNVTYHQFVGARLQQGSVIQKGNPPTYAGPFADDERSRRAFAKMYPEFNDGFSLANFLYELREIPQLMITLGRLGVTLPYIKKLIKDPSKTLSELLLTYSYGIAPLMSDLKNMLTLAKALDNAVAKFQEKGREVRPYHFREKVGDEESTYNSLQGIRTITQEGTFVATLWLSYEYFPPMRLNAWARRWGMRLNPEAIWNATPFSFLVDYVTKIGDWLSQFDRDPYIRVHLSGYCESLKCVTTYSEKANQSRGTLWSSYQDGGEVGDEEIWRWTNSTYTRIPGSPKTGFYMPTLDQVTARELVLSGALLRANLP